MQCKDIPDQPILEFLLSHKGKWCNWYFGDERDVHLAMPENTPEKLVLAKMRMLIRRGVVTGCPCGCRGDFEITEKGEEFLSTRKKVETPSLVRRLKDAADYDSEENRRWRRVPSSVRAFHALLYVTGCVGLFSGLFVDVRFLFIGLPIMFWGAIQEIRHNGAPFDMSKYE